MMGEIVEMFQPISGWVTEKKLSEASGLGMNALAHYRRDGKVTEGVHYVSAENSENGRTMWNVEEYNQWVKGSRFTKAKSDSGLCGKGRGATKRSTSNQALRV